MVKQVLAQRPEIGESLVGVCLAVVFFATPHHGSSVLSLPEYVQTVQKHLGLKWEMSENLRQEFTVRNPELESLNYRFAKNIVGTRIYSYTESADTNLTVLSTNDSGPEGITVVRLCVTDSRSGKLSTPETPVEDEEVVQLNTTHTDTPRFADEDGLYSLFIQEIHYLVTHYSDAQRTAFQALNKSIMSGTLVDVHQFYGDVGSMKILTARPSLEDFLELGPTQCMIERIRGSEQKDRTLKFQTSAIPSDGRRDSAPAAPELTITAADADELLGSPKEQTSATLIAPSLDVPKSIHTKRPSFKRSETDTSSEGHLVPAPILDLQASSAMSPPNNLRRIKKPQRTTAFKLPSSTTDRFKWIHVPFNHSGWVPHVLTSISQDKDDPTLHSKLLLDKMWFLQHNRSRHASPHARFVKPSVKFLFPEGESKHGDTVMTPTSAGDDIQFVLYMPYLHWDNFAAMQRRASIIRRRCQQADARPVASEVAHGKSLEHKVIWQHLTSDRPVHCRRTLDQYGYPSLRNTTVRDHDQILYKRTKPIADETQKEPNPRKLHGARSSLARSPTIMGQSSMARGSTTALDDGAAKVLMVDQLWLWIIDGQTVVSFFASKEREEHDHGLSRECDIRSMIYQDINGDYANQCSDPFDFAALAVCHAIKALLEDATDQNLQVFRIFEEYISILTERQTSSFKEFRNNHTKDIQASRHVDNRKDLDALLELRDIEDELNTIEKLIREQQTCVKEMLARYQKLNKSHAKGRNGTTFLLDVLGFLSDHESQVEEMLKSARMAQQAFKELLDMKQKQANVVEAHLAREQTEVATDQSRSVMIFTIFTIIFLPLSFFASVFGINAREWSGDGNNYLSLHQIFTYMGAISLGVIVIALLVAFSRHSRRAVQKVWQKIARPLFVIGRARLKKWGRYDANADNDNDNDKDSKNAYNNKKKKKKSHSFGPYDLEKASARSEADLAAHRLSRYSRSYSKMSFTDPAEEAWWQKVVGNGSAIYP